MDKEQKQTFITDLTQNILRESLDKLDRMPNEWDGIELRWFLAEKFNDATAKRSYYRARRRNFNAEMLTRNL